MRFKELFHEIKSFLGVLFERVSSNIENKDPFTIAVLIALIALMLLLILIRRLNRTTVEDFGPAPGYDRGSSGVIGRIEKLEMTLNEFKTQGLRGMELMRNEAGFIKQELIEIRAALRGGGDFGPEGGPTGGGGAPRRGGPGAGPGLLGQSTTREFHERREGFHHEPHQENIKSEVETLGLRLEKTRTGLFSRLRGLFSSKPKLSEASFEELEALLISSDLGVKTSKALIDEVKKEVESGHEVTEQHLRSILKIRVLGILEKGAPLGAAIEPSRRDGAPLVVMVVGVNGVGKTTTVAKLASQWKDSGAKVMMVAADTFRAAAVDQLLEWGRRIGVVVVKGAEGAKPATVVFDAMERAKAESADVVIIDTAGRLHTKTNLMDELNGVRNAIAKHQPGAPHETLLVLDATTGQNALSQAREFNEVTPLTGLVITKLDGTSKGGIVVAIREELGVPIRYIGVGEKEKDLRVFHARDFVEAIFEDAREKAKLTNPSPGGSSESGVRRGTREDRLFL